MLLAIDIGSSSVKAALLALGGVIVGEAASERYETEYDGVRAEVPVKRVEQAIRAAVARVDISQASAVGLITMAPAWLAMDEAGRALTPLITHQDRRSLAQAKRIEAAVGKERHLALAGNRPTPGGISSTTAAWFAEHTDIIGRAAMLGHLPTYLFRKLTGQWLIDPSHAGFSGLMDVATLDWSHELCEAAGVTVGKMPEIGTPGTGVIAPPGATASPEGEAVLGDRDEPDTASASREAVAPTPIPSSLRTRANDLAIPPNLPLFGGLVDGSGSMLLAGANPGQIVHSVGSTDVIALCLDRPMPREGLLCRPLGARGLWLSAATLAAGGSALSWAWEVLYPDLPREKRDELLRAAARRRPPEGLRFDPHLAGDRQSVDQPTGAFTGLTLATSREDLLAAVVHAVADDCAARARRICELADEAGCRPHRRVLVTGRLGRVLEEVLHAGWPGDWELFHEDSATVRGLACL